MNRRVLSKYDLLTVGEAAGVTVEEAKKYANEAGTELNMVFHFEHTDGVNKQGGVIGKWTTQKPSLSDIRPIFNKWQLELEGKAWNSLYWDNHDQPRAVSHFGNDSEKYRAISAKMLATCLHMMKGTPYIYQGEELGMTNTRFRSVDDCRDIEEINAYRQYVDEHKLVSSEELLKCFEAIGRDNARTPMQWDKSANAGFTTGTPWIAVNENYTEINAEDELADPDSVFSYYQKLVRLRHENPVIVYGTFVPLLPDDENIYAYRRVYDDKILTVACNWSDQEIPCDVFESGKGDANVLICNYKTHKDGVLQPYEARVILETVS
jgi:oligo-1,6-glucosidase